VWLLGIGPDNIRKVFLGTPSNSHSFSLLSDVESTQATVATMDREMARLHAELEDAKAAMASMTATLFAKERAIQESEQRFSHLSRKYRIEVTEHCQAQSELRAKDSEIQRLKEVQATTHSFSPALTSASSHSQAPKVQPAPPKKRELKHGAEILFRGYGRPQRTAVPECTASDGYHHFSGSGTNGYAKRYTCKICAFVCSESKRRY